MITQQIFCLSHYLLKESVSRDREITFHFVQIIHREENYFRFLNALHAKVASIILFKSIFLKANLAFGSIFIMNFGSCIND